MGESQFNSKPDTTGAVKVALLSLDCNLWEKVRLKQLPVASKKDLAIVVATGTCCCSDVHIGIASHFGFVALLELCHVFTFTCKAKGKYNILISNQK